MTIILTFLRRQQVGWGRGGGTVTEFELVLGTDSTKRVIKCEILKVTTCKFLRAKSRSYDGMLNFYHKVKNKHCV